MEFNPVFYLTMFLDKKTVQSLQIIFYSNIQIEQIWISMENLDQFVNCVVGIAKENYDVTNVIKNRKL